MWPRPASIVNSRLVPAWGGRRHPPAQSSVSPRSCRGQQGEDTWPLPVLELRFLLCSPESWACVHPALGLWVGMHVAAPLASQTGGTFLFITHGSSRGRNKACSMQGWNWGSCWARGVGEVTGAAVCSRG